MQTQVHLRHQRGGGASIGQRHRLRHQPHDVAGQLRHLRCRQRHARTQAPGLAHRRAGIQQRLVLRFVAAIPLQEATPGQLPDLLTHQLLFVVPIAQALLHGVGVVAQLPQLRVRTQPHPVVGEARIGLHQRVAAVGLHAEQAGAGQLRVRRAHHDAVRRAARRVDRHAAADRALPARRADGAGCADLRVGLRAGRVRLRSGRIGPLSARGLRLRRAAPGHPARAVQRTDPATTHRALRTLHAQVGQHRPVLHIGRGAALVEVAQSAHVDVQRAAAGDRSADLAGLHRDRRIAPLPCGAVVRVRHVVEAVGAVQRLRLVGHAGRAGDPVDAQVAAGSDARIGVVQVVGDDMHRAARVDHRIRTRARLQHVLHRGARGDAVLLVVVQAAAAGALRMAQDVVWIGVGVLHDQPHAVARAGTVRIGVCEGVALVVEFGCARLVLAHPSKGIAGAAAHLVRIDVVIVPADVVDRHRACARVQPRALAGGPVQRATGEEVRAGLRRKPDRRLMHLIAIGRGVHRVLQDVLRVEVIDLVRAVVAGGADVPVKSKEASDSVRAVVAPAGLIQAHRRGGGRGLRDDHVLADVVERAGVQRQRASDFDGRAEVVHPIGIAGGLLVAIQRTADGRIAIAVDQGTVGVGQLAHADVQTLARGHRGRMGHPGHALGTVEQRAGGDGDVVPIHPPGAHVVHGPRLQLGQRAVDQAAIGQLPARLHVGDALAAHLPAGRVVHIGGRQIQIVRAQHALVQQIAVGVHGQIAVGDQLPGIGQALVQAQAQIALGLHLSIAAERARGQELVALRAQHPGGVGDRVS